MGIYCSTPNTTNVQRGNILQLYNQRGRKLSARLAQDMLENLLMGMPSNNPKVRETVSHASLQLLVPHDQMNANLLVQGMSLHHWISIQEMALKRGYMDKKLLEGLCKALGDSPPSLERLELSIEESDDPLERLYLNPSLPHSPWPVFAKLLQSQPNLKELDLGRTYFRKDDKVNVQLFVDEAFGRHVSLKKIVMVNVTLRDFVIEMILRSLANGSGSTHNRKHNINLLMSKQQHHDDEAINPPPSRTECVIMEMKGPDLTFGPSATNALIKYLPHLDLQYLQYQDLILERRKNETSLLLSFSYWLEHINYLDRVYQRFEILRDHVPAYLWPLLGYCEDDSGEKYCSKSLQVRNQLCLAGYPINNNSTGPGLLVVNWEATWKLHEAKGYTSRPKWPELWTNHVLSLPSGVILKLRQENSFRASAIFGLLRTQISEIVQRA